MLVERKRKVRRLQSQKTFATPRNLEGGACTSGAGANTSSSSGRADPAGTAALHGTRNDTYAMNATTSDTRHKE